MGEKEIGLLLLAHPSELVVRIDVRLEYHDIERAVRIIRLDEKRQNGRHGEECKGTERKEQPCGQSPVPPVAIGQGHQDSEDSQIGCPDPERTAKRAGIFIPLDPSRGPGEGIAKDEPWPADFRPGQVEALPGNPGKGKEYVGNRSGDLLAAPPEQAEDERHLKGIGKHGEYSAS